MANEKLSQIVSKLKDACDEQDWETLKLLDQGINADIQAAIQQASTEQERASLVAYLKRLQKIYKLVIEQGTNYRDEISTELRKLNKDKKVSNLYLDSSKYF